MPEIFAISADTIFITIRLNVTLAEFCLESCLVIKQNNQEAKSGVYSICPNGKEDSRISVYCDQSTAGGGWMLLLTQTHATDQYSVNPLTQDLNATTPSPLSPYSRDWSKTEIPSPPGGSEFLLKRGTSGQFVRFVQDKNRFFCGFGYQVSDCNDNSGALDVGYYTIGKAYDQTGKLLPETIYFNGCNDDAGCNSSGIDGIGFGSLKTRLQSGENRWGYGAAWPGGLRWNQQSLDSGTNVPYTYWYKNPSEACLESCLAIKQNNQEARSGVYSICPNGQSRISVYCDQSTAGGGWMLLLTQNHGTNQYTGSVNPLTQDLLAHKPSPLTPYSRDWSKTEIPSPRGGSEFLLKRGTSGQFVRFVQDKDKLFCGFGHQVSDCNNDNAYHSWGYYTEGKAYDQTGKLLPDITYFNGCNYGDGCNDLGVDGIGFGSVRVVLQVGDGHHGYGVTWPGGLHWNQESEDSGANVPYTYWYKPAQSASSQKNILSPSIGTVFTRWGSKSCPQNSTKLYDGFMAGSEHDAPGGGTNFLCMHPEPHYPSDYMDTNEDDVNSLHGVEYGKHGALDKNIYYDAACVVCQHNTATSVYVQWGRVECSNGHLTQYSGLVMASRRQDTRTENICMDLERAEHGTSSAEKASSAKLYPTEFSPRADAANEGAYKKDVEVACAVCTPVDNVQDFSACQNKPGWTDMYGNDCSNPYYSNRCVPEDTVAHANKFGVSAKDACCSCGGGDNSQEKDIIPPPGGYS